MAYYLDRQFICDRLRLSRWQSYRIIKSKRAFMVSTADVVKLLNESSVLINPVAHIPADIVTAEEAEQKLGIEAKKLMRLAHKGRNPLPHYRMNKQTTRFRLSVIEEWMEGGGKWTR